MGSLSTNAEFIEKLIMSNLKTRKILGLIGLVSVLYVSCKEDDDDNKGVVAEENPPTEAIVELGVKYGDEARQFMDIYKAASNCATPVYFDAHGNGGNTDVPNSLVETLNSNGISIIAWESLTTVSSPTEVETGWSDAELMFQWVIENSGRYNFDTTNFIIGGSSRGSILSWKYGHSGRENIKGLYMYNALPSNAWGFPSWWYPPSDVSTTSPFVFFVYKREPGSSMHPADPDIHDPNNGFRIMEKYDSLGIGNKDTLIHSIGDSTNTDRYQYLIDFALSVIETCP